MKNRIIVLFILCLIVVNLSSCFYHERRGYGGREHRGRGEGHREHHREGHGERHEEHHGRD